MNRKGKLFLAGHAGMVGSAFYAKLLDLGFENIVVRSSSELDLTRQDEVEKFFGQEKPDYVILAAAKVGGIRANNDYRAQFLYENLMIQSNVIHASYLNGVEKLLFLGSSCIYPKNAPQPLKEEYLLTGSLEYTNEPYALAKIAGIKLCENYYRQYGCNFISVMPTNMYGSNDNYSFKDSHVLPALVRKTHLGKALENQQWDEIRKDLLKTPSDDLPELNSQKEIIEALEKVGIRLENGEVEIQLWGTGEVYREFLYADDFAEMSLQVFNKMEAKHLYSELKQTHINIGTGEEISIRSLTQLIRGIIGFKGSFVWGTDQLNGTIKKRLDISLMKKIVSYEPVRLEKGIEKFYKNYINYLNT